MTVGYLRVSSIEQDIEKNKADILTLANKLNLRQVLFIEEKLSGKLSWRKRKIYTIFNDLNEGSNFIVSELSRLGRSMLECMEILSIATKRGIRIYAIKGNWHLDDTIQSKIIAMASEIEHDFICSPTREALRARQASGEPLGRPTRDRGFTVKWIYSKIYC